MPNMTYCRFENTFKDLKECLEALEWEGLEGVYENANEREKKFILKLLEVSKDIASYYEDLEYLEE